MSFVPGKLALSYLVAIIGIPVGVGRIKMAGAALAPFGRKIVSELSSVPADAITVGQSH